MRPFIAPKLHFPGYMVPFKDESEALLQDTCPLQCTINTSWEVVLASCCCCASSLCTIVEKVSSQGGAEAPV